MLRLRSRSSAGTSEHRDCNQTHSTDVELDRAEWKDGAIEDAASCVCHVSRCGQMP